MKCTIILQELKLNSQQRCYWLGGITDAKLKVREGSPDLQLKVKASISRIGVQNFLDIHGK